MRIASAFLLASLLPAGAHAQSMIEGVYTKSPEQCAAAAKDFQSFIETGETVLTARGIEGIEYNCEFLDWKMATRSPGAIVTALCEEPGYAYPEIYAIMPRGEGQLEFTVPLAAAQGDAPGNYGTYYLCKGVTMP